MPKYVHPHVVKRIALDSVAFICPPRSSKAVYVISDRENRFNEEPNVHLSLIKEGCKLNTTVPREWQFRLAIAGDFHFEQMKEDVSRWHEYIWILFNKENLRKLRDCATECLELLEKK